MKPLSSPAWKVSGEPSVLASLHLPHCISPSLGIFSRRLPISNLDRVSPLFVGHNRDRKRRAGVLNRAKSLIRVRRLMHPETVTMMIRASTAQDWRRFVVCRRLTTHHIVCTLVVKIVDDTIGGHAHHTWLLPSNRCIAGGRTGAAGPIIASQGLSARPATRPYGLGVRIVCRGVQCPLFPPESETPLHKHQTGQGGG